MSSGIFLADVPVCPPVQMDWMERLADGLVKNPLAWFCVLLVSAIVWLARQNAKEREALEASRADFATLSKEYGGTMVRLEHVLAGLTRMRDEYKRQLAELNPKKKVPDEHRP